MMRHNYGSMVPEIRPLWRTRAVGIARTADPEAMRRLVETTGTSCLFVRDSGRESALA